MCQHHTRPRLRCRLCGAPSSPPLLRGKSRAGLPVCFRLGCATPHKTILCCLASAVALVLRTPRVWVWVPTDTQVASTLLAGATLLLPAPGALLGCGVLPCHTMRLHTLTVRCSQREFVRSALTIGIALPPPTPGGGFADDRVKKVAVSVDLMKEEQATLLFADSHTLAALPSLDGPSTCPHSYVLSIACRNLTCCHQSIVCNADRRRVACSSWWRCEGWLRK